MTYIKGVLSWVLYWISGILGRASLWCVHASISIQNSGKHGPWQEPPWDKD